MAGDRHAGVDPRFDPAFQRGYDPSKHTSRVTPRVEERREATRLETAPEQPRPVTPPVDADEAHPDPVDDLEPPRRNPFRLILLLTSVAAIAGAALLLWRRIEQDPYGGYVRTDVVDQFAQQFVDALLVPLLTGGLIGLCLWLALGALVRRDGDHD